MHVIGFCGYSGSGKTTLVEQLIPHIRLEGLRVSVVKHAHHAFDIDHQGKDSWRHRQAGAFEVVVASDRRLAKIREFEVAAEPSVDQLIAELYECDWVLVEGFKHAALLKIEVWRAETGKAVQYPDDPYVVAIATDSPDQLPVPTGLPVLDLNQPHAVADFLLGNPGRYEYLTPFDTETTAAYADADAGRGAQPLDGGGRPSGGD
jgi:molybdopterin-guanine dinucleotide biosynthesis adapter protein